MLNYTKRTIFNYMKIIKDEYGYNIFYEVDDFSGFSDSDITIKDFTKINHKVMCFVNNDYDLFIVELTKGEHFYKFKGNNDIFI